MTHSTSRWAWLALVLGMAHAGVSLYWASGGSALLETVGGDLATRGREGGAGVVLGLVVIAAVKASVAVAGVLATRVPASGHPHRSRWGVLRPLTWVAAIVLVLYGGVLTCAGLLVQVGALQTPPDADHYALGWHAYFWDPWFLVWGLCLLLSLHSSRPRDRRRTGRL